MRKIWFAYIITNHTNTVLYTGITNNLVRRIFEHKKGLLNSSFTKKYRLYKLIWCQEFSTPQQAIEAEKKIKGWIRRKKISLIKQTNPTFKEISLR